MSLTEQEKDTIFSIIQQFWSRDWIQIDLSSGELRTAVDNTDAWIEANQVSYNNALNTAAQNNLSVGQKTLLFCAVAIARVNMGWLNRLIR